MSTNLLSITLQSDPNDFLLLLLFAILAAVFLAVFFSWWRAVSETDLEKIIASDAVQIGGPALTGAVPVEYAEAEALAIADREILMAATHGSEQDEINLPAEVEENLSEDTIKMVEAEISKVLASSAAATEPEMETAVSPANAAEPEPIQPDDFKKIEGIGPKIADLLHNAGISTYAHLANTSPEQIQDILDEAGPQYKLADPTSWPQQAQHAAAGEWEALKALQDKLIAGRH